MTGSLRRATAEDLPRVLGIYSAVCRAVSQLEPNPCGWREDIYPTRQDAEEALGQGALFLLEDAGEAVATVVLNQDQPPEYREVAWHIPAADDQVLVVHTFMVDPAKGGKGYGRALLQAAAGYGEERGLRCVRLDTTELNLPAQRLYQRMGYRLCGMVDLHLGYEGYKWYHCYELPLGAASE